MISRLFGLRLIKEVIGPTNYRRHVSPAETVELSDECFLKRFIGSEGSFVAVHKSQKARLEIVPVHYFLIGVSGFAIAAFSPDCPAVLCSRLV